MNKKEVLEIKKQFTPVNCTITKICSCYVDYEKNIVMESKQSFLSLPEEESFKYFDLFKHTLSGSIGKSLINMNYSDETQQFLLALRNSKLKDDNLIKEFYEKIINTYHYNENYYIILIHAAYDIPGKASDQTEMFDASDEVYDFILCSLCPVQMSKPGLSYNTAKNSIENRIRDWVVNYPMAGFLYPAFNERSTDIYNLLFYTKKADELPEDMINELFGCETPMSAVEQRNSFNKVLQNALGRNCDFDTVNVIKNSIHKIVNELETFEENQLGKVELINILENNNLSDECINQFGKLYAEEFGEKMEVAVSNIIDSKYISIKSNNLNIKVESDSSESLNTKIIDGRKCLVIAVDDILDVDGLSVLI